MQVHVNSFVKRQTEDSPFSHTALSWEDVAWEAHCALCSGNYRPGYRDGVILVDLDPSDHFSGVVQLTDGSALGGAFEARRPGETPRKSVVAIGADKLPAVSTFVVLYSSAVLAEDGDNELPVSDGNWEMISLNSSPVEGEMPIAPEVLMANYFHDDGGTDTQMSAEEFVEALRVSREWWADKAMAG